MMRASLIVIAVRRAFPWFARCTQAVSRLSTCILSIRNNLTLWWGSLPPIGHITGDRPLRLLLVVLHAGRLDISDHVAVNSERQYVAYSGVIVFGLLHRVFIATKVSGSLIPSPVIVAKDPDVCCLQIDSFLQCSHACENFYTQRQPRFYPKSWITVLAT